VVWAEGWATDRAKARDPIKARGRGRGKKAKLLRYPLFVWKIFLIAKGML
jgi:hypothetical protein